MITSILSDGQLGASDLSTLLDWLDKVRIGLWLGFFYLNKNNSQIRPKFHIESRLRRRDRCLVVYKVNLEDKGINFIGTDTPAFQNSPSCFALRINEYYFFNMSSHNMCDRRLGFPYSPYCYVDDSDSELRLVLNFTKGMERTIYPVMRRPFIAKGTHFFQPIFSDQSNMPDYNILYDTPYVKDHSMDWASGIGKIFYQHENGISLYPESKSDLWIPSRRHKFPHFVSLITDSVHDFQIYLFKNFGSFDHLSQESKRPIKLTLTLMKKWKEVYSYLVKKGIEAYIHDNMDF